MTWLYILTGFIFVVLAFGCAILASAAGTMNSIGCYMRKSYPNRKHLRKPMADGGGYVEPRR